ncbi:hypothetical protein [Oryzisolibacter sp. LB2S]|uniref:hypothetical protein n=1 Tax=Alicycliphilus soli TaxID=3228789 RepID=UPI0034579C7E
MHVKKQTIDFCAWRPQGLASSHAAQSKTRRIGGVSIGLMFLFEKYEQKAINPSHFLRHPFVPPAPARLRDAQTPQ